MEERALTHLLCLALHLEDLQMLERISVKNHGFMDGDALFLFIVMEVLVEVKDRDCCLV